MLGKEKIEYSKTGYRLCETSAVAFMVLLICIVLVIAAWSGLLLTFGLTETAGPLEMILEAFSFAERVQAGGV